MGQAESDGALGVPRMRVDRELMFRKQGGTQHWDCLVLWDGIFHPEERETVFLVFFGRDAIAQPCSGHHLGWIQS